MHGRISCSSSLDTGWAAYIQESASRYALVGCAYCGRDGLVNTNCDSCGAQVKAKP
jgi:primosomal protein N'